MRKSNEKSAVTATTGGKKNHLAAKIYKYRGFYLMFLPVLIFALIFFYLPMLGIRFAFTDQRGKFCWSQKFSENVFHAKFLDGILEYLTD